MVPPTTPESMKTPRRPNPTLLISSFLPEIRLPCTACVSQKCGVECMLAITRFNCLGVAALIGICLAGNAAEPPAKSTRAPWTTSRVVGSPDPPAPFKVVRAYPNLKFEHPLLLARAPGMNRVFVGEQAGVLYSFVDKPDAKAELFCDLRKEIKTIQQLVDAKEVEAVYGLCFHPGFAKNRQCFVCYTLRSKTGQANLPDGTRV